MMSANSNNITPNMSNKRFPDAGYQLSGNTPPGKHFAPQPAPPPTYLVSANGYQQSVPQYAPAPYMAQQQGPLQGQQFMPPNGMYGYHQQQQGINVHGHSLPNNTPNQHPGHGNHHHTANSRGHRNPREAHIENGNNTSNTSAAAAGHALHSDDPIVIAYRATPESERGPYTLDSIAGHVVAFANDSEGSRGLQRMISEASGLLTVLTRKGTVDMPTIKPPRVSIAPHNLNRLRTVFQELQPRLQEVIFSTYGNFVIQKFIETQCCEFIVAVAAFCKGRAVTMAKDDFGCRILQNLVETQLMDEVAAIVAPHVVTLVNELNLPSDEEVHEMIIDQNANHVLQRCMTFFPQETAFVAKSVLPRFTDLAKHVYGSRVIQCIFEQLKAPHVKPEDETRSLKMMYLSLEHFESLVNTQYGNFAVTHALVNSPSDTADMSHIDVSQFPFPPSEIRCRIVDTILPNIISLSSSKFASNVAQRVFQFSNEAQQKAFMVVLQQPQSRAGTPNIVALMMDQYANYVMQDVFVHCTEAQKSELLKCVRPYLTQISRSQFGRHIIGKTFGGFGGIGGGPKMGGGRGPNGHGMQNDGYQQHAHHIQQQPVQYGGQQYGSLQGAPNYNIVQQLSNGTVMYQHQQQPSPQYAGYTQQGQQQQPQQQVVHHYTIISPAGYQNTPPPPQMGNIPTTIQYQRQQAPPQAQQQVQYVVTQGQQPQQYSSFSSGPAPNQWATAPQSGGHEVQGLLDSLLATIDTQQSPQQQAHQQFQPQSIHTANSSMYSYGGPNQQVQSSVIGGGSSTSSIAANSFQAPPHYSATTQIWQQ
eukprot:GILI01005457.1.p1 GENE.GILI01005457.1~~GILI01005457.1.p1  ORF type:complete len:813 (-),score=224.29 GILI01005457.1:1392-3830(-)